MADESPESLQRDFFARQPLAESAFDVFDALPEVYCCIKDRHSRFVRVNSVFLDVKGIANEMEAIGLTDRDFHPPALAEAYIAEDSRVMSEGRPLRNRVWLMMHRGHEPHWYVSAKNPLRNTAGDVVGLINAMYRIEASDGLTGVYEELAPAVRHIEANYASSLTTASLAEMAGISPTHFNRRFRQLLNMSPARFVRQVRVHTVQKLLVTTNKDLAEIAAETGFADQSHMARRFRESTGMNPAAYRRRFRKQG
ncbi:MAG: helix-turn-helix domain-containing protein [Planctomycetota bacterium]